MTRKKLDVNDDIHFIIRDSNFAVRQDINKPALFKNGDRVTVKVQGESGLPELIVEDAVDPSLCFAFKTIKDQKAVVRELTDYSQFYSFAIEVEIQHIQDRNKLARWQVDIIRQSRPSALKFDANYPYVDVRYFFNSLDKDIHSRGSEGSGGGFQRF